ncbi:N-acetylmuramoyl-L-alanine amidase-like domain-containing protein [Providencia rustigianii]|uniref:N-acetylmuramoyl-L-alanine amidase-like domain-containing protein n=1 Tax=Providencia rustigianii TaxID=158850 RepID=UPI002243551D|nr:N-acetylmuramoyl-L-alanine amidase-like domain-containing protein [Providencia rustigianii]
MSILKSIKRIGLFFVSFLLYSGCIQSNELNEVVLTAGSYKLLENVISAGQNQSTEQKVINATTILLGTPYNNRTLNMNPLLPERLVIDLKAMDCMTFIEYSEAFKHADNLEQFSQHLEKVRYIDAKVAFDSRRHFFTDWSQEHDRLVDDITSQLSPHTISVNKQLNLKENGGKYISSLDSKSRVIHYIPVRFIDHRVLSQLKTGDYIGIYSPSSGLDVTHVGIVIRENNKILFRHASSQHKNFQVIDIELSQYLKGKEGILVFR